MFDHKDGQLKYKYKNRTKSLKPSQVINLKYKNITTLNNHGGFP